MVVENMAEMAPKEVEEKLKKDMEKKKPVRRTKKDPCIEEALNKKKRDGMKKIRAEELKLVNEGKSYIGAMNVKNEMLIDANQALINLHKTTFKMPDHACIVCKQKYFGLYVGPRTKMCTRCSQEKDLEDKTFSESNHMQPGKVPESVKKLTPVELNSIKPACPMIDFVVRKGGASAIHGNAISFAQDLSSLAKKLPRLPEQLPYVYLTKTSVKDPQKEIKLKIRPKETFEALKDLMAISPAYAGIELSQENMDFYYDCDGNFTPTNVIDQTWENAPNEEDREGPMNSTDGVVIEEGDFDFDAPNPQGIVPQSTNTKTVKELLKEVIMAPNEEDKDTSDTNAADKEDGDVEMQYPSISSDPLKELEPGFFASLFPDLFPDGKGDYKVMGHSRPGKQVTLKVR